MRLMKQLLKELNSFIEERESRYNKREGMRLVAVPESGGTTVTEGTPEYVDWDELRIAIDEFIEQNKDEFRISQQYNWELLEKEREEIRQRHRRSYDLEYERRYGHKPVYGSTGSTG